jgi:DNA-binding NarL/FixJ family response regulator
MICDDAAAFSILLAHWIQADGDMSVVATTSDPEQALVLAADHMPDVVILDHLLGAKDSAALVPDLRAASPAIRVLLISGMPVDRLEQASANAGADGFVSKASSAEQIRQAIHAVAAG